jgi:hypothetical protein
LPSKRSDRIEVISASSSTIRIRDSTSPDILSTPNFRWMLSGP